MQTSLYFRTPDDKLRWAFKMYDEDNSREIDIREMESVMVVSRYLDNMIVDKLSLCLSINNVVTHGCIGDGESKSYIEQMLYVL